MFLLVLMREVRIHDCGTQLFQTSRTLLFLELLDFKLYSVNVNCLAREYRRTRSIVLANSSGTDDMMMV